MLIAFSSQTNVMLEYIMQFDALFDTFLKIFTVLMLCT